MSEMLPIIYLARHGETAWSLSGQHTGLTDLPLTERGERNARQLGHRLSGLAFAKVFTSPLQRAMRTVNWPALDLWPKLIATCSNGTTASMRAGARLRFLRIARTGNFSVTAVPGGNRPIPDWRARRSRGETHARGQR